MFGCCSLDSLEFSHPAIQENTKKMPGISENHQQPIQQPENPLATDNAAETDAPILRELTQTDMVNKRLLESLLVHINEMASPEVQPESLSASAQPPQRLNSLLNNTAADQRPNDENADDEWQ